MKKKPLAYYLDLMKSDLEKENWVKAKRHGETALKKLHALIYTPADEYFLFSRLAFIYKTLSEYSCSLEVAYKADIIVSKNKLSPLHKAYISYLIGGNLLSLRNINQALVKINEVEEYYNKYGDNSFPMDKRTRIMMLMQKGHCYLYKDEFTKVADVVYHEIPPHLPAFSNNYIVALYYHFKGEYLSAVKKYEEAKVAFEECLKISEEIKLYRTALEVRIHLAIIDILNNHLEHAIKNLKLILKDARNLKINYIICGVGVFLSKCYSLKNMHERALTIEKRIKPFLNKLDITWFYEMSRGFEQLYKQVQSIYKTNDDFIPIRLSNTIIRCLPHKNAIIGESKSMQEIYQLVEKIAPTDLPVLIQGETGTGKELIARAIHNNSPRSGKTWLVLNCAALPESLLENELFGHAKGAFTDAHVDRKGYIELASEGTLFLDEIADMSPNVQQKLLRVLEEKQIWRLGAEKPVQVNTRFIFASNQNIEELVKAKKFREDLYYRINTIVISLPPLRDRKDDIPLLVKHFLRKIDERKELKNEALKLLVNYNWPGNIRELENEIKRICVLSSNIQAITENMLPARIFQLDENKPLKDTFDGYLNHDDISSIKELKGLYEKKLILASLKKYAGNMTLTARGLGWSRRHLYRKMEQFKIPFKSIILPKSNQ